MKTIMEQAMEAGAMGMTTALIYPPSSYAGHGGADRSREIGGESTAASTRATFAAKAKRS